MSIKKQMIEALKHSIEKTEADIVEYSKPCEKSLEQNRTGSQRVFEKAVEEDEKTVEGVRR